MTHLVLTGCQKISLGEVSGTIFSSANFKRGLAWVSITSHRFTGVFFIWYLLSHLNAETVNVLYSKAPASHKRTRHRQNTCSDS